MTPITVASGSSPSSLRMRAVMTVKPESARKRTLFTPPDTRKVSAGEENDIDRQHSKARPIPS
ncbi:hypothetical protein GCM10008937_00840 [Deinococcus depolymerans]|uniref:Uncharacterized protein n=1 Tax=Deinococcus depolymerans TaxID=392408 RepID=A0ABN1BGU5_9DEIO